jgi:sedoheptulokinase
MFLGIDIGTTSISAAILDQQKHLQAVASLSHNADLNTHPGWSEQDPQRLLQVAEKVILSLDRELRRQVKAVGVTGQMHGLLLLDEKGRPITPLVTWQDRRCLANNLISDLQQQSGYPLDSGFGCATLAWYIHNQSLPESAASACTIQDYLVSCLTASCVPFIDPTNAASWGCFNLYSHSWDQPALERINIPKFLLPDVLVIGQQTGVVCHGFSELWDIPLAIPVAVALGDNQASLLATLTDPDHELAVTLGTGGQVSSVVDEENLKSCVKSAANHFDIRPFTNDRFIVVAAILSGGSAWAWLAHTVQNWCRDMNLKTPDLDKVYQQLNSLGVDAVTSLEFHPHFLGERYDPGSGGKIEGLQGDNFQLGQVSRALARGIFRNLHNQLPAFALQNRTRLVASGNALRHNPLLQKAAEEV